MILFVRQIIKILEDDSKPAPGEELLPALTSAERYNDTILLTKHILVIYNPCHFMEKYFIEVLCCNLYSNISEICGLRQEVHTSAKVSIRNLWVVLRM